MSVPSSRPFPEGYEVERSGGIASKTGKTNCPDHGCYTATEPVTMAYYTARRTAFDGSINWGHVWMVGTNGAGAGSYVRFNVVKNDIVNFGPQFEAGLFYAGARLPLSVQPVKGVWITTQPSVGAPSANGYPFNGYLFRVPIGLSFALSEELFVDTECGLAADPFPSQPDIFCGLNLSAAY